MSMKEEIKLPVHEYIIAKYMMKYWDKKKTS